MITFDQVTKVYNGGWLALDKASFSIDPGEFVLLTGASGAGKSTILRLIYMDEAPDTGEVSIVFGDGEEYRSGKRPSRGRIQKLRRRLGIVFQDFKLLSDRTIFENVALALRAANVPEARVKQRVFEVLTMVRLSAKARRFPHELSGGEQQRAAIARAMANDPEIVLADEPTGNLDSETSVEILRIFHDIHLTGVAVLMATHDELLTGNLPVRRLCLDRGVLTDIPGTYTRPAAHEDEDAPETPDSGLSS
ncbi:MAG TPA: ATP-binding cassette domain-containing protein [Fibrobacteria bacterium]|jgi:cell division transport system ATP-binding protein|nr:ATP-binding cassette domain-containing protein [Fibrobacteria bacterium]